jgi:hypothetical protein
VLTGLALLAAGCGGSSPSAAGSSATPSSSAAGAQGKGLAYTACMRSHGVPNFPDPNSDGHISITPADGIKINSPQFQSAQKACQSLSPGAGTPAQQAQHVAAALKYAKCMRSHGITSFPDPNAQGGFQIQNPQGNMNPSSPQNKSAQKACQHYLSQAPGGGQTVTSGGGGGL